MHELYPEFFLRVTGNSLLPYQERYARNPFCPTLLNVGTGLGKTDAVLMPWLHARATGAPAPRRLIIVLPRQNLTKQTAENARRRLETARLSIRVLELMGGSGDNDETLRPDEPAIIVATQDLYFSRALNRGYARRPPRWPIDFALYNQDCLIVLDEIQLMDDALATSTQLAAFRERFGAFGPAPCVWMSATANAGWLRTVDFRNQPRLICLDEDDRANPTVAKRIHAAKALAPAPGECNTPAGCAEFALARHRRGTRTLVIANTVQRAREIFAYVRKSSATAILLHSRFRPRDRKWAADALERILPEGQIVVATQVLEAGVDITARVLITDLAPWASLVQRFGRVNRYGDEEDAEIWWVRQPASSKHKEGTTAPYSPEDFERAVARLEGLQSAAPADLPDEDGPAPYKHVLRRADLVDLFDTTPDLSGNEIDVSRFIRATEDKDVYVAWREWEEGEAPPTRPEIGDDELCPAPIGEIRDFVKKRDVFALNFATEKWSKVEKETPLYPGMILVARAEEGGYTALEGWSPESKTRVAPAMLGGGEINTDTSDPNSFPQYRQSLRAHTERVVEKMNGLLEKLDLDSCLKDALRSAALKHDWGKIHKIFQDTMRQGGEAPEPLAKQCGWSKHSVPHFRHELASALAMIATGDSDLAAYLVAAHHGKIRLGIRSMPGEGDERTRGIADGEILEACTLASGVEAPPVTLRRDVMRLGAEGGSWTERMLRLRDELGPFRLAYLEMLLRAADEAASETPGTEVAECA
jgi:CRISPR-associated endonuclease/helicase Cas3